MKHLLVSSINIVITCANIPAVVLLVDLTGSFWGYKLNPSDYMVVFFFGVLLSQFSSYTTDDLQKPLSELAAQTTARLITAFLLWGFFALLSWIVQL